MNDYFDEFYNFSGFGPNIQSTPPSQTVLEKYSGKLPDRLLEYWQEYGFCGWAEGLYWTVNPDEYTDILATWLEGTQLAGTDNYYVIGRSAFGKMIVWGESRGNSLVINGPFSTLFPTDDSESLEEDGPTLSIDLFFASSSKDEYDLTDEDETPLFERAVAKLGPLNADEMYAFVPALALGGAAKLENLQIVKTLEHLSFLADLGEKQVMADIVALSNQLHASDE